MVSTSELSKDTEDTAPHLSVSYIHFNIIFHQPGTYLIQECLLTDRRFRCDGGSNQRSGQDRRHHVPLRDPRGLHQCIVDPRY